MDEGINFVRRACRRTPGRAREKMSELFLIHDPKDRLRQNQTKSISVAASRRNACKRLKQLEI